MTGGGPLLIARGGRPRGGRRSLARGFHLFVALMRVRARRWGHVTASGGAFPNYFPAQKSSFLEEGRLHLATETRRLWAGGSEVLDDWDRFSVPGVWLPEVCLSGVCSRWAWLMSG